MAKRSSGRQPAKKPSKRASKSDTMGELEGIEAEKQRLGERMQDLTALSDLVGDVGTNELLESMLTKCLSLFQCKSGSIFLCDQESGDLELVVAEGPMKDVLLGTRQAIGDGIAGMVAQSKAEVFVRDITDSEQFSARGSERYETNSFACVPIIYRGDLLGVLNLTDKESGEPFDAADVGRMLAVAGFSAGTIRQSLQQRQLRGSNIELHKRLDAAYERLQAANQELARLKNFNERILTGIMLGLIAFDENFNVTFCNGPACEIFGIASPEEMSERMTDLVIQWDGMAWADVLNMVVKDGKPVNCGSAEYLPDGVDQADSRMLTLSASPLRDGQKRVTGGVVVIEDVTERSRMERRLAASERHAVIGKLAARVAHELNNPLDGILRFINLSIALKGEDDPTREYLTECKKGLERMVGIVSSLLEFSRSTYPTQHDTRLNEVVEEAVRTLRHRAEQQKIEVTYTFDENIPEMRCGELVQVFLNLTKNAYDAMKEGGTFKVATRLDGQQAIATVADSGCGMPDEILNRVFDPFFTTKGPSEGTGLGLAICHDIVEKHGGGISVDSEVGKGTTFTITLPVQ
jgi:PAS domain S-box-containing protein